ncbi:hypothetical protein V5O48_000240 [Marasmius crinis-equi]|uniref:F-box domain-containing protein n=1 Tax=Marasmius crinis-equi TaxID=585013 RepID=A0ABR3G274_9AGAR
MESRIAPIDVRFKPATCHLFFNRPFESYRQESESREKADLPREQQSRGAQRQIVGDIQSFRTSLGSKETQPKLTLENSMEDLRVAQVDARFCHSDYTPSRAERCQLEEILQGEVEKLEQCREEIASLEETLKSLKARKRGLDDNIRHCRSVLAVHRQVPTEIWDMIFTHLCLSLHNYSFEINHNTEYRLGEDVEIPIIETPTILLSQVCSRWRQIVHGLPRLWTSISVELQALPYDITESLLLHFSKARDHPLRVRIVRDADEPRPPLSDYGRDAWRVLEQSLYRCKVLVFEVSHLDFLEVGNLSFPQLEHFCEEAYRFGTTEDETPWFWEAIHRAPKLRSASVWSFHDKLPCSRLVSLHIRPLNRDEIRLLLDTLPTCEYLKDLTLEGLYAIAHMQPAVLERAAPSLKELTISPGRCGLRHDNPILSSFLTSLSMPSLVSFKLTCEEGWPPSLLTVTQRSPSLERFTFCTHIANGEDDVSTYPLLPLFQSLAGLKQFELYVGAGNSSWENKGNGTENTLFGNEILSAVLSNLRITPDSHILVPKLEVLSLRLFPVALNSKAVDEVEEVLLSRYMTSRPLREFHLHRTSAKWEEIGKVAVNPSIAERVREIGRRLGSQVVVADHASG